MEKEKYEIVRFEDGDFKLDVSVSPSEDTVWLTQYEMSELFDIDKSRISRHIKNVFDSKELDNSVVAEIATTAKDGKTYIIKYYNLDMIISVGYRVNSKRGILFRRWASSILKQYLLKGYIIDEKRCLACQQSIIEIQNKIVDMEKEIDRVTPSNEKAFLEGELVEPYSFVRKLFFLAKHQIIIIDGYADKFLIDMLRDIKVDITIITYSNSYLTNVDLPSNIKIEVSDLYHDRFIVIDDIIYQLGTSFNEFGKKRFVISKLNSDEIRRILKNVSG